MSTTTFPPPFDPTKPFEVVDETAPKPLPTKGTEQDWIKSIPQFSPEQSNSREVIDKAHAAHGREAVDQLTLNKNLADWDKSRQQITQKQDASYVRPPLPIFRTKDQKDQDAQEYTSDPNNESKITGQIAHLHPDIAPDLRAAQYKLNVEKAPENHDPVKVEANAKALKDGKLNLNFATGQLQEPLGVGASIAYGWDKRQEALQNYETFMNGKDEDIAKMLNGKMASFDPDAPVKVPQALASAVGSESIATAKMIVGGGIPAMVPGLEELAPAGAALLASPEYYKRKYAETLESVYMEEKKKGATDQAAMAKARDQAQYNAELSVAQGAAMTGAAMRIGSVAHATGELAPSVVDKVKTFAKEGFANAGLSATFQGMENAHANKVTTTGMLEAGAEGAIMPMALGMLVRGVHVSPDVVKTVTQGLSKLPELAVDVHLGHMVNDGAITKGQAADVKSQIQDFKARDAKVPETVEGDQQRISVLNSMEERDALQKKIDESHPALKPIYKEQLKALDQKIAEQSGFPTQEKTEKNEQQTTTGERRKVPSSQGQTESSTGSAESGGISGLNRSEKIYEGQISGNGGSRTQEIDFNAVTKDHTSEMSKLRDNITAPDVEKFLRKLESDGKIKIEC